MMQVLTGDLNYALDALKDIKFQNILKRERCRDLLEPEEYIQNLKNKKKWCLLVYFPSSFLELRNFGVEVRLPSYSVEDNSLGSNEEPDKMARVVWFSRSKSVDHIVSLFKPELLQAIFDHDHYQLVVVYSGEGEKLEVDYRGPWVYSPGLRSGRVRKL